VSIRSATATPLDIEHLYSPQVVAKIKNINKQFIIKFCRELRLITLIGTLKPLRNGPLYSNTMIGTNAGR